MKIRKGNLVSLLKKNLSQQSWNWLYEMWRVAAPHLSTLIYAKHPLVNFSNVLGLVKATPREPRAARLNKIRSTVFAAPVMLRVNGARPRPSPLLTKISALPRAFEWATAPHNENC